MPYDEMTGMQHRLELEGRERLIVSGVVLVLSIIMSAVFGAVLFEEIYDTAYYEYYY